MCITFPARVVGLDGPDAIVHLDGRTRRASLVFRSDIAVGDWVMVGAGSILRRIDATEAAALEAMLTTARASTPTSDNTTADPSTAKRRSATPPGGPR